MNHRNSNFYLFPRSFLGIFLASVVKETLFLLTDIVVYISKPSDSEHRPIFLSVKFSSIKN